MCTLSRRARHRVIIYDPVAMVTLIHARRRTGMMQPAYSSNGSSGLPASSLRAEHESAQPINRRSRLRNHTLLTSEGREIDIMPV